MTVDSNNRRRRTTTISLFVLLFLLMILVVQIMAPFLRPLFVSVVLAVSFAPLYEWLTRKTGKPGRAAWMATLAVLLLVVVPLGAISIIVVGQAREVYQEAVRSEAETVETPQTRAARWLDTHIDWVASKTGTPATSIRAEMQSKLQDMSGNLVKWATSVFGNLGSAVGNAFLAFLGLYMIFSNGTELKRNLLLWSPLEEWRSESLLSTISQSLVANVYGMVAVAVIQGILVAISFLIAGVPSALFWGVIATLTSPIPLVGPTLVWIPGAVYLLMKDATGMAIFVVVWGVLIVGMSDNIVRPLVVKGRVQMNGWAIFFALLGGVHAFGLMGLFVGPTVFAVARAVMDMLQKLREEEAVPAE